MHIAQQPYTTIISENMQRDMELQYSPMFAVIVKQWENSGSSHKHHTKQGKQSVQYLWQDTIYWPSFYRQSFE